MNKLLNMYLNKKLNPAKIRAYIQTTGHPESLKKAHTPKDALSKGIGIKVSCVQREIDLVNHIEQFIDRMEQFVKSARAEGSEIVVFPEYNFFDLVGLIPGFRLANKMMNKKAKQLVQLQEEKDNRNSSRRLHHFFRMLSGPTSTALLAIMSELAKKYEIYIYTGSYLITDHDQLYNAGSLLSRDGNILGTQKKLHLTDFEESIALSRADSLQVFELDFGRVAIPICMDATYFETFSMARKLGADIVIIPIANNEEYHAYKALRGIWPRVQESFVFGFKSSLNGWLAGMHFTGKAGIFAPIEYTLDEKGVINIASHYEGSQLVSGMIDIEELHKIRGMAEYYGDRNAAFEAAYYQNTYARGRDIEV